VSAKLVDGSGHLQAARIFEQTAPLDNLTPAGAAAAFNRAFEALARELVPWTASPQ
jgi:phospholipid/cholesterol/gamma-HCH transport system substrate-binding protein